jgi:hypothetical protein
MGALGFDAVYRQDFVGWSGTSTKSQVGREVLALTTGGGEWEVPEEVSLHVNCAVYSNGSIVLSYSNLAQSPVVFLVDGLRSEAAAVIAQSPRVEYFLTTGEEGNVQSASVQLNGGGVLTAGAGEIRWWNGHHCNHTPCVVLWVCCAYRLSCDGLSVRRASK